MIFTPDFNHILDAAKNIEPKRIPLYEHNISDIIMEKILNKKFSELLKGNHLEKKEYFKNYCDFFLKMGYDTVTYEACIGPAMPGSGALGGHQDGIIKNLDDFKKYPWHEIKDFYFNKYAENFELIRETLPLGMKAIGGVGNGVFECVQDVVGYENLCYIKADDEELYALLFQTVGNMMSEIWGEFMNRYSDIYCVCRFGDDLGFKSTTLLSTEDIKMHIIPQYSRIVEIVHSHSKPFLLHSCGCIFDVMDDIIQIAKIDAKHSNEDQISQFNVWVDKYGDKIGNFGGVDTDHLCRKTEDEIRKIVFDVMDYCKGKGGFALGSGNSIPDYVPVEGYLSMIEACKEKR